MAAAGLNYKQDMPPRGGFSDINYKRNLPVRVKSGWTIIFGGLATMAVGFYLVVSGNKERRQLYREKMTARLALLPLLQAEQDRRVLRALKANVEAEAEIMKNVPGWQAGDSVYNADRWIPPVPQQITPL